MFHGLFLSAEFLQALYGPQMVRSTSQGTRFYSLDSF
jgi:hypothetical protein